MRMWMGGLGLSPEWGAGRVLVSHWHTILCQREVVSSSWKRRPVIRRTAKIWHASKMARSLWIARHFLVWRNFVKRGGICFIGPFLAVVLNHWSSLNQASTSVCPKTLRIVNKTATNLEIVNWAIMSSNNLISDEVFIWRIKHCHDVMLIPTLRMVKMWFRWPCGVKSGFIRMLSACLPVSQSYVNVIGAAHPSS